MEALFIVGFAWAFSGLAILGTHWLSEIAGVSTPALGITYFALGVFTLVMSYL